VPRSLAAAIVLIPCAIAASACGGGSSAPTTPSPSTPFTITVSSQNGAQSFSPNPATVGGQMVVFRNADSVIHRVRLNDMSIDTGNIAPGGTSSAVTMPPTGTNYHCALHPDMIGAISPSGGGEPPRCEGVYCSTAN
jgi:plastocyanin